MKKNYINVSENSLNFSVKQTKLWLRCRSLLLFLAMFLFVAFVPVSNAQIVTQGAAVKVNFGIDADIYSNYLQNFQPGTVASGTDDWFQNLTTWPGGGQGIIDQTNAAALKAAIQADNNYSFVKRMSKDRNSIVGNYTWIDAVYARDNNSTQSNTDATVFTATKDKNGDSPATWNLGTAGSPQKNDLIDVFGHMRMDNVTGDVWGIGALTTVSYDGNSHADFEFFANQVTYNGSNFMNTGTEGGHSAWHFNADGSVLSAGDLLIAVDFENGGTSPNTRVRVWISDADFASLNSKANRDFDLLGTYDSGLDATGYGYAGIVAKNGGNTPSVWAIVNTHNTTLGAPWGTLEGSKATFYDDIKKLQFTEFAINLSSLGLDAFGGDACNKKLGTLIVKTRSSSSFTSELKDFAGPFVFGFNLETNVDVVNLSNCEDGSNQNEFDLNDAVADAHDGNISFFNSENDANNNINAISATQIVTVAQSPKTFWVRSSNSQDEACFVVKSFTVTTFDNPTCNISGTTNVSCNGADDGSATVSADGGTGPYTYLWSNVQTSATATGLASGGYTVKIFDAHGCMAECEVTITEPDELTCEITDSTNVLCYGGDDGSATVTANGGTTPYTYLWSDGQTTAMVSDLVAGHYTVTVKDAQQCTTECEVTITEPDEVTCEIIGSANVLCNGGDDGSATVSADGGTAPYTYLWSDGQTIAMASGLVAGHYTVTVTDAHQCNTECEVTITEPDELMCEITGYENLTKYLSNDGSIDLSVIGGTPPYSYAWTGPGGFTATTQDIDNLEAGQYYVTVTDANNCVTYCDQLILWPPSAPSCDILITDVSCYGGNTGSATVNGGGGSGIYSFTWFKLPDEVNPIGTGVTQNNLYAGLYKVIFHDDISGLESECTNEVTEPDELTCEITGFTQSSCGQSDGTATVSVSGGTMPYYISWDNGETTAKSIALSPGIHNVHITDANNCESDCEVEIPELPCMGTICTYTQGYFGNSGGKSCDGEMQYTTAGMIKHSVDNWGGMLIIGKGNRSVIVYSGDASCVISRLPGGKGIGILPSVAGGTPICSYNLLIKGKIDNKLLAQTLTLGLNLGIGTPLGDVELNKGYIVAAKPDGGCGSNIPLIQNCVYEEWDGQNGKAANGKLDLITTINPYNYSKIDTWVVNEILKIGQPATVNGLFELANQALGGLGGYSTTQLTAISDAVDNINNLFDGCRVLVEYNIEKPICVPFIPISEKSATIISSGDMSEFKVYPNPFSDKLQFEFSSPKTVHAKIDMYDMTGRMIQTIFNNTIEGGTMYNAEFKPGKVVNAMYFYRITLGDQSRNGKVLYNQE